MNTKELTEVLTLKIIDWADERGLNKEEILPM